ncbi:CYFA0S01e14422g1_1 [Cyberlindnera fabianii]|uniref:ABC transporter CDR4 n=1 Tax=Cyberlindnera fabianii TaxID=36022 RepID=A0A061AJ98_CYBFA|nr:ABC transporter CDR4 [Cyberlindnera fabianii]CDR37662.1 CYFA0S01e14422g1_1 [Cyberlindnera fabianii]
MADPYESDSSTPSQEEIPPNYEGFNASVHDNIQRIARQVTNSSQISDNFRPVAGETYEDALSRVSTIAPGVNPMGEDAELDPRLDPNSDEFNSTYWIKNFRALMDKDPDHYQNYALGVTFKNLRAYGNAADADYQTTALNAPLKYSAMAAKWLFSSKAAKVKNQFDILKPMDGVVRPGEVVVVLGRPGSGCTTLLKSLASSTHGFHIADDTVISYEGLTPREIKKQFRGEVIYSAETDVHFPHLTVGETLGTAAKFRVPERRIPGISREDYAEALTDVFMATYGVLHTKNTKVGSSLVRGVSGGERKRVSIAEVSLAGARLQCWDNATRGLDSATALEFIRALRVSADILDTSALIAIYQCSQDAYDLFDKVCVLYEGYQIFYGPATTAKEYFIKMGWDCPPRQTTADFLTSVTSARERVPLKGYENKVPRTPAEFYEYWRNSPEYKELVADVDASISENDKKQKVNQIYSAKRSRQAKGTRKSSPYTVSFALQVKYLLRREVARIRNDWGFHLFSTLSNALISLVFASIFYNLPFSTGSFQNRGAAMFLACLYNALQSFMEILSLFESRPVVEKHKGYALYHPAADALASIIAQLPTKLFSSLFFNLIFYFMVNFRRSPGHFFFYLLASITATFAMSHFFRVIGSLAKSLQGAVVPAHVIMLCLMMFVGFTTPVTYMLGWCRWINYLDPLAYTFEALMVNEFSGREFPCSQFVPDNPDNHPSWPSSAWICSVKGSVAGERTVSGDDYLEVAYSYRNSHKWRNWGISVAFMMFLLGLYMLCAEFNESAKQKGEILLFQRSTLKKIKKQSSNVMNDLESGNERSISEQDSPMSEKKEENLQLIKAGEDIFHWRDVKYSVKTKTGYREILGGVDGWVKPGTLTALMGASGAGKTTLLDVLANRVTMGVVTGSMFVNGHLRDSSFQRSTGYVQQQDLHLDTATVREAMRFSAYLRQPSNVSREEKNEYVEECIRILDMEKYADAVVGVAGEGLNVEQRKRLTIGVELAARPKLLLFFDEPTSGLDSQTAWSICQLMRKLTKLGQAVLCTIHQPSSLLMQEFDRLLFLARGGRPVYFGDLGEGCQTMINYFESHGAPPCPPDANPAEWMLQVIGAAPGSHANQDYALVWKESQEHRDVLRELERMETELVHKPVDPNVDHGTFAAPYLTQLTVVTHRVFQQFWRTPSYIWSKIWLGAVSSLLIGFVYFKAGTSIQGLQNQMFAIFMFFSVLNPFVDQNLPMFASTRDLYESRERPAKTFSWHVFLLSEIIADIPWNVFVGTLAFLTFYYPTGFYRNAEPYHEVSERGAYGWLFTCLFFIFIGTLGQFCVAAFDLIDTAGFIASLLFIFSLSFCGILVTKEALPGFWIFMYRVSPFTYFASGFLTNSVAHNAVICTESEFVVVTPPGGLTCNAYLGQFIGSYSTGYIEDPSSTTKCAFCAMSFTDDFLASVGLDYNTRWRDLGIFIAYIFINIAGAALFYWLFRVPKKSSRVELKQPEGAVNLGAIAYDEEGLSRHQTGRSGNTAGHISRRQTNNTTNTGRFSRSQNKIETEGH